MTASVVAAPRERSSTLCKYLGLMHGAAPLYRSALRVAAEVREQPAFGEPFARERLAMQERAAGADHRDVAIAVAALAALLDVQDRIDEAEPLYRRALRIFERHPQRDGHELAVTLSGLAAFRQQGHPPRPRVFTIAHSSSVGGCCRPGISDCGDASQPRGPVRRAGTPPARPAFDLVGDGQWVASGEGQTTGSERLQAARRGLLRRRRWEYIRARWRDDRFLPIRSPARSPCTPMPRACARRVSIGWRWRRGGVRWLCSSVTRGAAIRTWRRRCSRSAARWSSTIAGRRRCGVTSGPSGCWCGHARLRDPDIRRLRVKAHRALAGVLRALGRYDEADVHARRAIALAPRSWFGWRDLRFGGRAQRPRHARKYQGRLYGGAAALPGRAGDPAGDRAWRRARTPPACTTTSVASSRRAAVTRAPRPRRGGPSSRGHARWERATRSSRPTSPRWPRLSRARGRLAVAAATACPRARRVLGARCSARAGRGRRQPGGPGRRRRRARPAR